MKQTARPASEEKRRWGDLLETALLIGIGKIPSDKGNVKSATVGQILLGPVVAVLTFLMTNGSSSGEPSLHALFVGGGPDLEDNGAAIESHLRFASQLLSTDANRLVHFTDGKPRSKTVSFTDSSKLSIGRRAMEVLLPNNDFGPESESRAPDLGVKVNGPARREDLRRSIGKVAASAKASPKPVLIYFAGHGSHNSRNEENNSFSLWNDEDLSVTHLAAEIARLPPEAPIALVMVQCYSGAFANLIFRHGDPSDGLIEHDLVGFFAASKDRMAAGCGSEIHEPDYQDFSSYFFGALAGKNRLGQPLSGADYDGNGMVTMHEAFCFALIHDGSSDTPTCTSDSFLRRYAPVQEPELFATPFARIEAAATPAQRAVLEALSEQLELTGEQRLSAAKDRLEFHEPIARSALIKRYYEDRLQLNDLRQRILATLFSRWPMLRWSSSPEYSEAADAAVAEMDAKPALCRELLEANQRYERADAAVENEQAFLLRFVAVCTHIIRRNYLQTNSDAPIKGRFNKLWEAEQRTLPLAAK
ncbi:MAG TPA: hypothetical protein VF593_14235 [Chthoniobacteraceae bacterium]